MINVVNLHKDFKIHQKEPGIRGSINSLFRREYLIKKALAGVNLKVHSGEILGLIGANGAGKTTLIKILAGIIHPTSGEVSISGHQPWERDNEYRRQMSLIMGQKASLWWDLPALDSYLLLKEIYQIPDQIYKSNLEFLADTLKIKDQLKIQVRRLSLGERMKVELMAALLHRPQIVYLDEPTIGLDLTAQKAIRKFIQSYRQEFQPIMILTSHYMEDIESLCKRIAIIQKGRIIYDGELLDIYQTYAQEKMITIHSHTDLDLDEISNLLPKKLGLASKNETGSLQILVPRVYVKETTEFLTHQFNINELNITEQPIGDIISKIMDTKLDDHE